MLELEKLHAGILGYLSQQGGRGVPESELVNVFAGPFWSVQTVRSALGALKELEQARSYPAKDERGEWTTLYVRCDEPRYFWED